MKLPNLLVYDIEAARHLSSREWSSPEKAGISVIGAWGVRDIAPYFWLVDGDRLPRALQTQDHCRSIFEKFDGVVTWNGIEYDDRVLSKAPGLFREIRKTYVKKTHIDLMALCCLIQAGVEPERLVGLEAGWTALVPTMRADLVQTGWSLDAVAKKTLGLGKLDGPKGKEAITAWQDGRYSEVGSYCVWDVAITRLLYIHALENGWLESEERGKVEIPRQLLMPKGVML